MWTTYIIQSQKDSGYYVGSTGNLVDRLTRHNQNRSVATKRKGPWKLVFQKNFSTKSETGKFEYYIKRQKRRKYIERLIAGAASSIGRASAF